MSGDDHNAPHGEANQEHIEWEGIESWTGSGKWERVAAQWGTRAQQHAGKRARCSTRDHSAAPRGRFGAKTGGAEARGHARSLGISAPFLGACADCEPTAEDKFENTSSANVSRDRAAAPISAGSNHHAGGSFQGGRRRPARNRTVVLGPRAGGTAGVAERIGACAGRRAGGASRGAR